ncbi:hypothetical protein GBAR_LOCUS18060 [Geodia barretti]|uniref:Fibronectin type-III domain-containing protein n=1 Tax=Geodia barretti TaxID=519541 RepID=A0AA35SML6_GEOBA|nr:hypothetical protein GBAR_LOCUS18060 [Geodia barretti]
MKSFSMEDVLVIAALCLLSAAQDISLVRTEPEQLPCPQQRIEFQCETIVASQTLIWTLPTSDTIEFGVLRTVGDVRNSSDNVYSATLTNKIEDEDPNTDRFFFTSTLLVLEPANRSNLTCTGGTAAASVKMSTTITQSGTPDPPSDLVYNDGVVIESSVDLQWTRPAHTGGVSLTGYNVSANGWSEEATDDGVRVSYTANSSFVYGEVFVTAVNYCGQESQPTAINIAAAAPPRPNLTNPLTCEDESAPWTIVCMYEQWKKGVVYPNTKFSLELMHTNETSSGDYSCSDVTANGTKCTVDFPRDIYNITVTLVNDFGSTVDSQVVDTRIIVEIEEGKLEDGTRLTVTVSVNSRCPMKCPVTVLFGTKPRSGYGDCSNIQRNVTKGPLSPGDSATFSVEAASVILGDGEKYCYLVSLCGNIISRGSVDGGLSPAEIGASVGSGLFVVVVVVVVLIMVVYKKKHHATGK